MSGIVRSIGKVFSRIDGKQFATGLAIAAGAYYLSGMATGSFGDSADGVAPGGGDESANLNMNPESTGTMDTAGSNGFGGTQPLPTPSPELTNMATVPDTPVPGVADAAAQVQPPSATVPPPVAAPPTPAPAAPTQPAPAGPSAPAPTGSVASVTPAPVSDLSTQPKTPSLPQGTNVGEWFKSLSPAAQAALAGGVAGGAGAIMNAIAAKNAQDFAFEREQRARDDVTRRGAISAFSDGAIKPRSGIINGVRGR
jgi:hypothetical protein